MSQQETNAIRDQLRQLSDNTPHEADRASILITRELFVAQGAEPGAKLQV